MLTPMRRWIDAIWPAALLLLFVGTFRTVGSESVPTQERRSAIRVLARDRGGGRAHRDQPPHDCGPAARALGVLSVFPLSGPVQEWIWLAVDHNYVVAFPSVGNRPAPVFSSLPLANRLVVVSAALTPASIDDELVAVDSGRNAEEFVELLRFPSRNDHGSHTVAFPITVPSTEVPNNSVDDIAAL
jgi:hypothetical protein